MVDENNVAVASGDSENTVLYNKYLILLSSSFFAGIFLYLKISKDIQNIALLKVVATCFIMTIIFTMLELVVLLEAGIVTFRDIFQRSFRAI